AYSQSARCFATTAVPSFATRRSSDLLPRQGGLDGVGEQDDQRLRRADPEGRRRRNRHLPRRELRQAAREVADRQPSGFPQEIERSEEHTSELQSHLNLVCRLLLDNKN